MLKILGADARPLSASRAIDHRKPKSTVEEGVAWVRALCVDLGVAHLSRFGVTEADFPAIIAQAQKASSMKGNPIALSEQELTDILKQELVEP
jgi:alcohol dehydrogenase class IV